MRKELKLSLVQMCSTNHHDGNIALMREHVARAAGEGAELVCFPEVSGLMNRDKHASLEQIVPEAEDPYLAACRAAAEEFGVWIHTGSTPVKADNDPRFLNRSHLLRDDGSIAATYDKIHLFDVDLPDGKRIRESDRYAPGEQLVMPDTPWGPFGMTVCYDLRFPQIYREYGQAGATVVFVPSAFAVNTGKTHWQPLLQARAIENGCFVIAAAQSGRHDDGRTTYGHAIAIDPWGHVMVDMENGLGATLLTLDLESVAKTRQMIPSLANEQSYRSLTETPRPLKAAG